MTDQMAKRTRTVEQRIGDVERRLELRRGLIEYNVEAIKERIARKTTWIPLGAAAGAVAIGFALARARSGPVSAHRLYMPRQVERKAGIVATVLALAGGATRFALSPQGRALWQVFKRGIERGRGHTRDRVR